MTHGVDGAQSRVGRRIVSCVAIVAVLGCGGVTDPPANGGAAVIPRAPAFAIPPGPYTPGQSYFGRNGYIEYVAGNAPVIYSAPHGGALTPSEIPNRTASNCGGSATTTTDLNTAQLVRAMQARHFARFGTYPHIIINHLQRGKLDANRTILEAACGDAEAEIAFEEWHDFIDVAKAAVLQASGRGWYMDMHGHGHSVQRLELGYLLTGAQLDLSNASLDANGAYEDTASVRTISESSSLSFSALLRGSSSLGTLYANNGFPSVPSTSDPGPDGDSYFSGGDNTRRHTCGAEATSFGGVSAGNICGVQIEANYTGVRDNATNRDRFADATAVVLEQYLSTHWGLVLGATPPPPTVTLALNGYRVKGKAQVDLTWSGATGASVDVQRNGTVVATTPNDGAHTDILGKVSGTFTYRVCNAGTTTCSNTASATF
jgi:hypothetical protein